MQEGKPRYYSTPFSMTAPKSLVLGGQQLTLERDRNESTLWLPDHEHCGRSLAHTHTHTHTLTHSLTHSQAYRRVVGVHSGALPRAIDPRAHTHAREATIRTRARSASVFRTGTQIRKIDPCIELRCAYECESVASHSYTQRRLKPLSLVCTLQISPICSSSFAALHARALS